MPQITTIFTTLDSNRDAEVYDAEWVEFYEIFVAPFEACDTSGEYKLDLAELTACLVATTNENFGLLFNIVDV